jgi:hypothetical protein
MHIGKEYAALQQHTAQETMGNKEMIEMGKPDGRK